MSRITKGGELVLLQDDGNHIRYIMEDVFYTTEILAAWQCLVVMKDPRDGSLLTTFASDILELLKSADMCPPESVEMCMNLRRMRKENIQ